MTLSDPAREEVLRRFGASPAHSAELLEYGRPAFTAPTAERLRALPLDDEPCLRAWEGYAREAAERGGWAVLRERLVQLRFAVRPGASHDPAYRAATRRGQLPPDAVAGVSLRDPGGVEIRVHPTPAGRIGVVVARERADFELLMQALTRRNEPEPIPESMGACIVGGYNNWDRVARLRERWEADPARDRAGGWPAEMARIVPRKELYQDRFVVLSSGPYSGTAPAGVDPADPAWLRLSLAIRLEHECAHYVTRRLLGSMRNTLHDEIIADFWAISSATGEFRAGWLLRFLGLEEHPRVRPGGRVANYRGTPPLSDGAFAVLCAMVVAAAERLEEAERARPAPRDPAEDRLATLVALAGMSIEEMASDACAARLATGRRRLFAARAGAA